MNAILLSALTLGAGLVGQDPTEDDYYRIVPLPIPEALVLEVSGITLLADGRPLVCNRRGEVFVVENAYDDPAENVLFHKFAEGLQEPLGLLRQGDWIYLAQRGELTRMRDVDGDDRADEFETICDTWRVSGNYHEYNFGPTLGPEGNFWITTNKPFGGQPFGAVPWRGFAMRITPEGEMIPTVCGLRSPSGVQASPWGDVFYTDNQGEWCGASKLSWLKPGSFQGHPHGLASCEQDLWPYEHPGEIPNRVLMPEVSKQVESFQMPSVWFPRDKMGRAPAGFVWDTTEGAFGPFAGQVFVTDQYEASVMRVSLEMVQGHWQGACYPFRRRLGTGALRLQWAPDGSLIMGGTDRGWPSLGTNGRGFGLERLVWTGEMPFELLEMSARPQSFHLTFTETVDPESALDPESYDLSSFTYILHSTYGSPEVENETLSITSCTLGDDGRSVELMVEGLRAGWLHELHLDGVRSAGGAPVLHPRAYYTLAFRPED